GAGGVGPALRGRPRWHPALGNDVALHEILTQPEFICWRVVDQVAGDISRRRLKLRGEGVGLRASCRADRCRADYRARPRNPSDFAVEDHSLCISPTSFASIAKLS